MVVTATEYQQNVGYYFDLVEKGEKVFIKKLKPRGTIFALVPKKIKPKTKKKKTLAEIIQPFIHTGVQESGLNLQKRVRS